jgi:hypothetical protein
MPSRSPQGGGDGAERARASLLEFPSAKFRIAAETKALVSLVAAHRGMSFADAAREGLDLWLTREAERLEGARLVQP